MKTLHRRCAGLDVHSDTVVACARLTERTKASHDVRRFSTATRDLLELADWLAGHGVTHMAMEATGVYWKPVWHILEGRFELVLANAPHIRNVPGRKSDVNDAVWISDLLAHGLIRASFVPPAPVQDLRDLTRTRTQLTREVTQHVQRLQKTLEDRDGRLGYYGRERAAHPKGDDGGRDERSQARRTGIVAAQGSPLRSGCGSRWARDGA